MRSGFVEPEIKLVKDGLVKNRRAATKTDQTQERSENAPDKKKIKITEI